MQRNELCAKVNIVEVISQYTNLRPLKNGEYSGLCPLHHDTAPSLFVSEEKQVFYCFGCHEGGDVLRFLMVAKKIDEATAMEELAKIAGIKVEESQDYQLFREAAKFYHEKLKENKTAIAFCHSRRLADWVIDRYLIGYASPGLLEYLKIDKEVLQKLGLLSEKGHDFLAERLIIPIFDHHGHICAFAGRALDANAKPKFINTANTYLWTKSHTLFGFYQAKEEIRKHSMAILVEGYFDVLLCHQHNVRYAVGIMGTAISFEQAQALASVTNRCFLAYDNDEAGSKALLSSIKMLRRAGITPYVVKLPEDPDQMILHSGIQAFLNAISSGKLDYEYILDLLKVKHGWDTPKTKRNIAVELAQIYSGIMDSYSWISFQKWLEEETMLQLPPKVTRSRARALNAIEARIVQLLLLYPELRSQPYNPELFEDPILKHLATALKNFQGSFKDIITSDFQEQRISAYLLTITPPSDYHSRFAWCLRALKLRELRRKLDSVLSAQNPERKFQEITKEG